MELLCGHKAEIRERPLLARQPCGYRCGYRFSGRELVLIQLAFSIDFDSAPGTTYRSLVDRKAFPYGEYQGKAPTGASGNFFQPASFDLVEKMNGI